MRGGYSDRYKDPRWQKKRLEILERDGFRCLDCDDGKNTLHVHHLYYISKRNPWDYPDWAFKTLCEKCHEESHEETQKNPENFELLIESLVGCRKNRHKLISEFMEIVDTLACQVGDGTHPQLIKDGIKSELVKLILHQDAIGVPLAKWEKELVCQNGGSQ